MRKTKIICTLGPSCKTTPIIKQMALAGMDCARINMSHGTSAENLPYIQAVKKVRKETGKPIAIMVDTKGPEVRIGTFKGGEVTLKNGQYFTLTVNDIEGDNERVSCSYSGIIKDLKAGSKILLNDGLISLKVIKVDDQNVVCKVVHGGKLSNRKSMFLPGVKLSMPFLSEQDKEDLKFAIKNDADYIAASFVSKPSDVSELRNFLNKNGGSKIKIISKIESEAGLKNIDKIIELSDGIMVARGDLGVELPIEKLPAIQKEIIKKANRANKIVITATEMLESMIEKTRPTRAETTDIANAVFDSTGAIMLSAETSVGINPVLALKTMAKIALEAEKSINYSKRFFNCDYHAEDITKAVCASVCTASFNINAKAIVVFTVSGGSAKTISKFKPSAQIIGSALSEKVFNQLALVWGVTPCISKNIKNIDALVTEAENICKAQKIAKRGDKIIICAGVPLGKSGHTNLMKVSEIK